MSLDFLHWTRTIPGIDRFWASIAQQVPPAPGHRCFEPLLPLLRRRPLPPSAPA